MSLHSFLIVCKLISALIICRLVLSHAALIVIERRTDFKAKLCIFYLKDTIIVIIIIVNKRTKRLGRRMDLNKAKNSVTSLLSEPLTEGESMCADVLSLSHAHCCHTVTYDFSLLLRMPVSCPDVVCSFSIHSR